MSSDNLEPCPFCGGEAHIERNNDGAGYSPWFYYTPRCSNRDCILAGLGDGFATEAEAIEAWNTRAERTCTVESTRYNEYGHTAAANDYSFDLSCGHTVTEDDMPDYCKYCGAKVIG